MARKKRLLILGGNGLVGRCLVRNCKEMDISATHPRRFMLDIIKDGVPGIMELLDKRRPSHIVNLAGIRAAPGSAVDNSVSTHLLNLKMTTNIIRAMRQLRWAGRYLFAEQPGIGDAQRQLAMALSAETGMKPTGLLLPVIFGRYDTFNPLRRSVIAEMISKTAKLEMTEPGEPNRSIDICHVDRAVRDIISQLDSPAERYAVSFLKTTVGEIAGKIAKAHANRHKKTKPKTMLESELQSVVSWYCKHEHEADMRW